ncbi:EVE domain-containing protein [Paracoccus sp. JM45]|uniref:EVE domain-containing protein n=1 Tax=Paracoccus sp. JM45 TaxID=2283626 RepID=UPI000E6B5AD6|nr:EVE domain-containing protein [Paracoccus sp. JM45]RJE80557.1 EVE domain-containing protein [Paracoccus sp. JM45]
MAYWLFKSEPNVFGWDDLVAKGDQGEEWDGVRNYQARNMMRSMAVGDQALFYHSNIGKEAVGICEVIALAHPDSKANDIRWECVDIKAVRKLPRAVSLEEAKAEPRLADMVLVNNTRLSVQPVTDGEWAIIMELSGADS